MNTFSIIYKKPNNNGTVDLTPFVKYPIKGANLLDERLDELELELERFDEKNAQIEFKPLDVITVTINSQATMRLNNLSDIQNRCDSPDEFIFNDFIGYATAQFSKDFLIAQFQKDEKPVGSGKYSYSLYLIEITKYAEGFIGDSITFTNSLGRVFDFGNTKNAVFNVFKGTGNNEQIESENVTQGIYKSLYKLGNSISVKANPSVFINDTLDQDISLTYSPTPGDGVFITNIFGDNIYSQYFKTENGYKIFEKIGNEEETVIATYDNYENTKTWFVDNEIQLKEIGSFVITYKMVDGGNYKATANFSVAENLLPLKKWTITDVLNRINETIEPLRKKEIPYFWLDGITYYYSIVDEKLKTQIEQGSLADKLNKILAPEFALSKMTLREMWKVVGGYIHAEPRIKEFTGGHAVLTFDFYGLETKSNIAKKPYAINGATANINDYCTAIDSQADNLINTLDFAQGVVIEPFNGGYKTVRASTLAVRVEDNDNGALLESNRPIYDMAQGQVKAVYLGDKSKTYDITQYVFERTDYNNLSSYAGTYPYSKSFALYYTQGEKNIKGLFFKDPDAVSSVFKKYAISNILTSAVGEDIDITTIGENDSKNDLLSWAFIIQYLPITKARIKTNKNVLINTYQRQLAYNQTANNVESRYYGEHLKGVVNRLGNTEKSITYILPFISDIPKVGFKFDDNYYISAVSYEVLPCYIKCTIGLTKDFNALSEYVGINKEKRMWEISERQAIDRHTAITEYLVLSKEPLNSDVNTFLQIKGTNAFLGKLDFFNAFKNNFPVVSYALVKGYSKNASAIANEQSFALPVVSSAFGNSLAFTFGYEDNFNAGQYLKTQANSNNKNGVWSNYANYTDLWGRLYYLDFELKTTFPQEETFNPNDLPIITEQSNSQNGITKTNGNYLAYRKDNREVPTISYLLQAVSASPDLIIGSGWAKNNGLVNQNPQKLYLIAINTPINALSSHIEASSNIISETAIENGAITIDIAKNSLTIDGINKGNEASAWAIAVKHEEVREDVADEDGNKITQTTSAYYELVLGANGKVPENGVTIYFSVKSKIYPRP